MNYLKTFTKKTKRWDSIAKYYFEKPQECSCEDSATYGYDECPYCYKRSAPLVKFLSKFDEDYHMEEQIYSTTRKGYIKRKEGGAVELSFSRENGKFIY